MKKGKGQKRNFSQLKVVINKKTNSVFAVFAVIH